MPEFVVPEFMSVPVIERENLLMPEIIRCLRNLGGLSTKKQIVRELKDTSEFIPEDFIDFEKISQRSGNTYKPFNYQFNFAIKHLVCASYLTVPTRGNLKLTEKGRIVHLDTFDSELVREISQPIIDEELNNKNKKGLNVKKEEILEERVTDDYESQWEQELLTALQSMSPKKFELFSTSLVHAMGVDIDKKLGVGYVGDGGIDGFGYIVSDDFRTNRVAIQAKRWRGKVSSPEIDKFRGAMDKFNAEFGIFVTTSDFTRDAIEAARTGTRVITLINGEKIVELVAKYELYVTPVKTYVLDDFYFEEN